MDNTIYDTVLEVNLISQQRAEATEGRIDPIPPTEKQDSQGRKHQSSGVINLTWWRTSESRSFSEVFFVVNSCGDCDAILRKKENKAPAKHDPRSLPLKLAPQTPGVSSSEPCNPQCLT